jgi:integrase
MAISIYRTPKGDIRYKAVPWNGNSPLSAKSFKRKGDAEEWERRQLIQIADKDVGRLKGHRTTFGDFFLQTYWPNKKIRDSTASDYLRLYDRFIKSKFGHRMLTEIDADEWSDLINGLVTKGMSKARANRLHAVASAVYKVAVKRRYANSNPLHIVDWYKLDIADFDFWQESELEQFLVWCLASQNPRFPLYQTAYETGMRISELIALQRDCVDLHGDIVTVRRTWCRVVKQILPTTKSGHKRRLGINPSLKATLQKQLQSHNSPYVFHHPDLGHFTYNVVEDQFQRDIKNSNARRITIHDLRHTYASHYMMNGGKMDDLKELMGHSDANTTRKYVHLSLNHLTAKSELVSFKVPTFGDVIALKKESPNHFPTMENKLSENLTEENQPLNLQASRIVQGT